MAIEGVASAVVAYEAGEADVTPPPRRSSALTEALRARERGAPSGPATGQYARLLRKEVRKTALVLTH
jgi:hypothetical protein